MHTGIIFNEMSARKKRKNNEVNMGKNGTKQKQRQQKLTITKKKEYHLRID